MGSSLLHKCMTKAITSEGGPLRHGLNWLTARRGLLRIFDDHLECGNWRIQYSAIQEAALFSVRSTFFIPGFVLTIKTPAATYHFGLNWGRFWKGPLPFPVHREYATLKYSTFSLILRFFLAGYIAYFILSHWKK